MDAKCYAMEKAFAGLGALARGLCCVTADAELDAGSLAPFGFSCVLSADEELTGALAGSLSTARALLVLTLGRDFAPAVSVVDRLSDIEGAPPVIVVILLSEEAASECTREAEDPDAGPVGMSFDQELSAMYSAGADEVACLLPGETLPPHRVLEMIKKASCLSRRLGDIVDARVANELKKKEADAQRKLEQYSKSLPGSRAHSEQLDIDGNVMSIGDYRMECQIGAGTFGNVFKSQHPQRGDCAVKLIPKARSLSSPIEAQSLEQEFGILLYLGRHANVVKAYEILHMDDFICVVMDYAGRLNLHDFMKAHLDYTSSWTLGGDLVRTFCRQQAVAVQHIHRALVCHRDLKPDNWIVDDSGLLLQLTDFGLSAHLYSRDQLVHHTCGTIPFCAPEVWNSRSGQGYSGLAADVWSLGIGYLGQLCGFGGVERLLGWQRGRPKKHEPVLEGLKSLARHVIAASPGPLGDVVLQMVVLQPGSRWTIDRVVTAQALGCLGRIRACVTDGCS